MDFFRPLFLITKRQPKAVVVMTGLALSLVVACTPPPSKVEGSDEKKPEAEETKASPTDKKAPRKVTRGTGPVAKVNGQEIARRAFDRQMDRTESRFQRAGRDISPALETRLKENLIRKMVDEELIRQKAKGEGLKVDDTELAAKLAEHKGRFGNDKAFASFLQRTSQSEEDIKADLEKNLLREKLFAKMSASKEPTDVDAKAYFDKNRQKYMQREQVKASHILLKVGKTTPADEKETKKKLAQKILKETKAKGADFAELAKKYSEGPTAKRGGDLGKFSRGRMVKGFEEAAFAANVGDIIGPVETQFGFHVIKIYEKVPERQREYDEVKESITTSLKARAKSKATREVLTTLKAKATIEVLEPGVSLTRRSSAPLGAGGKNVLPAAALKKVRKQLQKGLAETAAKKGAPATSQ